MCLRARRLLAPFLASLLATAALAQTAPAPVRLFAPVPGTAADSAPAALPAPRFFVDYDVVYAGRAGEPGTVTAVTSHGLRLGNLLVYNELASWEQGGRGTLVRGDSGVVLDWAKARTRLVLGDMSSSAAGGLADGVRLSGIGFQSGAYRAAASATSPFRAFAGETAAGGSVDVYVDGVHMHHAAVRPGRSPLRGLARFAGLRPVEVVVRDAQGQEVRKMRSGYRADRLLPAGASEFEYMIGAARDDGSQGDGGTAFVAAHRVALSDRVTLGGHFDGVGRNLAGTLGLGARLDGLGVISGEWGVVRDEEDASPVAMAGSIRYAHSYRGLNLTIGYLHADAAYRPDSDLEWTGAPAVLVEDVGAKLSYSLPLLGTITLTSTRSTYAGFSPQTLTTLTYSYERPGRWRFDWTLAHGNRTPTVTGGEGWMAGLNLTVALDAPVTSRGASGFNWASLSRVGAARSGFDEARDASFVQTATAEAIASSRRFETPVGTLYGRVDGVDGVSVVPSWQLGWSGSLVGTNGMWERKAAGQGI